MALTSNERKSLIASVDSAEITLSNGEKPEASVARDIRYAARQFLKAELAKVSTKAEADELVRGTFALMRSFDASDSAFSREKLRLSRGVQAASRDLRGNIASSTASASTETDETVEVDGLPSLGRINLGGDYSERSIDGSIPDFDQAKKPTLTLANLKDVNGSILGEGVIVRDRSGRRIRSVARGTTVSLTGEVVYMRGVDSAGHSQVLPYVVLAGGKTAVAAKFVAGIASAASAANPAPDKKTDVATSAATTGSASAQPTGTLSQPGATASTAPLPNGRLSDAQSSNPAWTPDAAQTSAPATTVLPMRPDEAGTVRGTVYDLARRWSYSTDTGHASALARLSDDDIREAWGTKEVRVVVTPSGKRILRDERNYDIATFDDLNKAEFEQFAPDALKAKAKDMELILKAAVASDGEKTEFASAYEAFRTAIGKYSAAHRNDAEIETAMTTAASSLDSQFGFMSRNVADLVIPGSLHRVQDILAQTDSSARRRMSYEWARNVSHDTLRQTILNDRFEKLTGTLGAQINDEDLNTVQQILGNFSDTAVGQFEAGINNPSSVSDPTQRAVYEKFHAILVSGLTSQSAREQSIKKFTLNIRRKIVDGGGEAKKYLENHARANHDAVVKQVLENTDIDVNPILATGGKTDKERDALERYRRAMGAVQSHVTAIFAITAVKTGIFDAAVEAAVRTDVLKNDPDTELYGDIMGKRGWSDWSDSTTSNAVNTLAFVLPEVIGMAAGIGIGYGVMRGVSWGISAANGARYARIAAASGRAGKALRMAEFGIEGVTYGTSLYMAGLAIPNLLHGRDWNEGFDRKELFFSMGLGAFYPAIHALSPMGKLVTGQGLLGKSMRFAGNTLFDTGVVMAGGWLVDISFGKGEWFEKDFWEVLAMMPLMRVGMNLSAGSRNSFLFKKDASGNIVTTMTDTRFAPAMDELTQSIRVLDRAPTGTPMEFPGSTVKKLPNGNFEVTPTASSGAVGQAVSPDQLMATIKQYAPELTPAHHAAMASRRADMELSRLMADNVPLPGGQRVTLENPAAPAADYRYTVKDSSGHVIATGVERSKLSGFVTQLNDATAAAHPTTGLLAQLRAGVPEVGDATAIRVVVKNPEAAEAARLCEIYHKNIKIADNLSINQVDTHLGSIFAAVDDANATRMITELQGTPAKLTNVEGSLQATMYGTPTSGPRYQIKQWAVTIDDLQQANAKALIDHGIPKKTDLEIKAILDPATPITTSSTGVPVAWELFVRYDHTLPLATRTYTLIRRHPTAGSLPLTSGKTFAEMETILKEGINKVSSVSADDFIDAMILTATPGKAAASHANVTLRPSVTAGKYDIEIAPPAGAPAGTAPQTYAEGLSLADARAIIAEGSVHASPSPAFLTQLRGPLAPHQVTFGNLKVTVENPAAAVADRTYLVECDGVVFSRGKKLAETDQYIADAAAIRDLDTALDTLSPTAIPPGAPAGTAAVPGARVAQVNGYWVHRQPHGEYTIGTQRFANRDALIAELAARDRASRTLFAQDSSLMRNYVDRIVDKLAKKSKVELEFAGNKVTIERLGANKFSVSDSTGTPAIVVDSFTSTQSQLRAAIVKKAGIEANGLRYLDENSPVVLQKALESLKGKSLAQAAGNTYKAGMAKLKNTKAKTLLEGIFRKESIPLYEGLFVNLPHNFARGKIFGTLGWVLTGGAKNTGLMSTLGNIAFVQGGAWGTTKLANGLESWAQGEGFMTGLKNDNYDNLGEWLLSTAAFGASSAWGKAFATIILNVDFDNFVGDTEEDLLTYIGKEIQKS